MTRTDWQTKILLGMYSYLSRLQTSGNYGLLLSNFNIEQHWTFSSSSHHSNSSSAGSCLPKHSHSQWLNFSHNNNHHYQSSEMGWWPVLCNYSVIVQIKRRVHYVQRWSRLLLRWIVWRLWLYSHVNVQVTGLPITRNCQLYFYIRWGCGATNRHMLSPCSIEWWINGSAHRTEPKDL